MPKKIYYAHSMYLYGSGLEKKNIEKIEKLFGDECIVINPATFDQNKSSKDIMELCFDEIHDCDAVVFSCVDDMIGLGVYREIVFAQKTMIPVYMIRNLMLYCVDDVNSSVSISAMSRSMWATVDSASIMGKR